MHNFYAFLFNKTAHEALAARYGTNSSVIFARTATAGTQCFPLCWGGCMLAQPTNIIKPAAASHILRIMLCITISCWL